MVLTSANYRDTRWLRLSAVSESDKIFIDGSGDRPLLSVFLYYAHV